jgi:hypothetical protein
MVIIAAAFLSMFGAALAQTRFLFLIKPVPCPFIAADSGPILATDTGFMIHTSACDSNMPLATDAGILIQTDSGLQILSD